MDPEKKISTIEEYNPFEHRNVKKPNSDVRSLAILLKASLGTGILAVPLAFSNSGWGVGIIGTVIIAFVCTYSVGIFVKTSQGCSKLEKKPLLNYAETCKAAFANGPKRLRPYANFAGTFAEISMIFTYLGVCCIFTVLIADSVKQLFDRYLPVVILDVQYYCLILIIPLCLVVQVRHLKYLAPFSLMANVLLVATFGICLYYIFEDEITFKDKKVVGDPSRLPAFLSIVIFAMEGMGVVMPIENAMKNPKRFLGCPGILAIAMSFMTVLYVALGVCGYLKYGDELRGSITLNLPLDDWPAICAKIFIALSIFLTYPIHFYVVIDGLTRYMQPYVKDRYKNITQVLVRIAVVCFCGGIGVALPMLEQIINFVGSFFYSILGLMIPGLVETIYRWESLGKWNWILWKNILLIIFGIIALLSGCVITVIDVMEKLHHRNETLG